MNQEPFKVGDVVEPVVFWTTTPFIGGVVEDTGEWSRGTNTRIIRVNGKWGFADNYRIVPQPRPKYHIRHEAGYASFALDEKGIVLIEIPWGNLSNDTRERMIRAAMAETPYEEETK